MEDNRHLQPIRLRLRQYLDATCHRTLNSDLRGRVPQDSAAGQLTGTSFLVFRISIIRSVRADVVGSNIY